MKAGRVNQYISMLLFALDSVPWYLRIGLLVLFVMDIFMGLLFLTAELPF
jgi:uncharacterized membrane protein